MGGMAGHAGLFATAADVAALTESYLGTFRRTREFDVARTARARSGERTGHRSGLTPGIGMGAQDDG